MALVKETYLYEELKDYINKYGYKNYSKQSLKYAGEEEGLNINLQEMYNGKRKITVANTFIEFIFEWINYEEERADLEFWLNNYSISEVYYLMIEKLKIIIKEGLIEEIDLYRLGKYLTTETRDVNKIKLGLTILRLSNNENAKDIFSVFSIHNEYVFYCLEGMKEYRGANSFIFDVAKRTKGFGKFMAVSMLEPLNEEIKLWLIESGSDNDFLEDKIINIILDKVSMEWYVNNTKSSPKKFNVLAKILKRLYINDDSKKKYYDYDLFYEYLIKFHKYGRKFSHLYGLMTIITFIGNRNKDGLTEGYGAYKEVIKETSVLEDAIKEILQNKYWIELLNEEVKKEKECINEILEVALILNDKLDIKDLLPILEKNPLNFNIYKYIMEELNNESKDLVINFIKDNFSVEDNSKNGDYNLCLYYVVSNIKDLAEKYLDYNIEILEFGDALSKKEAFKNLRLYKESLTEEQFDKINFIATLEEEKEFSKSILRLISSNIKVKEIVSEDVGEISVEPELKDVFLISTNIAGMEYRNLTEISNSIDVGNLVYLKAEEDNLYDDNSIKVITEDGWNIGYIPKGDNYILRRLLDGEKKLYGIIEEVNEYYVNLKISVYLSRNDVEDEVNDILKMILVESTGLLN